MSKKKTTRLTFVADNLLKFDSMAERIFRAKMRVTAGDNWTTELADQSSMRFQYRAKFYQDAIDQMINRSDLKEGYKRSEVLALDGYNSFIEVTFSAFHIFIHLEYFPVLVMTTELI